MLSIQSPVPESSGSEWKVIGSARSLMRVADMHWWSWAVSICCPLTFTASNEKLHFAGEEKKSWTAVLLMMQEANQYYYVRDKDTIFYRSAELLYV